MPNPISHCSESSDMSYEVFNASLNFFQEGGLSNSKVPKSRGCKAS